MENFVEKELSLYLASYLSENYDSQIAARLAAGAANSELTSNTGPVEAFPGYLDRGTPLIIEEGGRQTVIGLFKGAEIHRDRPSLFYKIDPDAFNWIVKKADEVHDSSCESFTSCSCGIPRKQKKVKRMKRTALGIYKRNDQYAAISNNPHNKYPWETAIFVRIYHDCPSAGGILKSPDQNWNERDRRLEQENSIHNIKYDQCSGSLITNKGNHKIS